MDRNFKECLKEVLKHEGGWSDRKDDPGAATQKGVTIATFRRYIKPNATKADLKAITDEQLQTVYRRHYWDAVNGASLPDGIDMAVFDYAVNSGPGRAAKALQKVLGVSQDGKIGPATIKATKSKIPSGIVNDLCDERLAFMKRAKGSAGSLKGKPLWPTFGKGWQRRVEPVRKFSLDLAERPTPEKPTVVTETVEVPVTVEKPVVTEKVEKEVRQKTNWLSTAFAGIFGAGGISSYLAGMDKDSLILVLGIGIAVIGAVLFGGEWIVRRVRSIRKELASD